MNQDYTQYLGSIISNFIKKHNIKNLTQFALTDTLFYTNLKSYPANW
jgi:hypothetical protein